MFADQWIYVNVYSTEAATGAVFVGDAPASIIAQTEPWGSAQFEIGYNIFPFEVDDLYEPENLWASACGGTSTGGWGDTGWIQGYSGNPPTCQLSLSYIYEQQPVQVTVNSYAVAGGNVSIRNENNILLISEPCDFIVGDNEYTFWVNSAAFTTLWVSASGTTAWEYTQETDWVQCSNSGGILTCNLSLDFRIDLKAYIYSNIPISTPTVTLKDQWTTYEVFTNDLKKGWNEREFLGVYGTTFNPTICYVEANAEGVGNESYTLSTTNDFILNQQTEYYESDNLEFCFENKPLHENWNWESFPKLTENGTTNNGPMNFVPSLVNNIDPDEYDWLLLDGQNLDLEYEDDVWDPPFYAIWSTVGVKIKLDSSPERAYIADGTRVLANTEIELDEGWNWIGYWLPHSEMCDEVFGDDWNKVNVIMAEDWYYDDLSIIRGGAEPQTPQPKPFHYGEGYMIKMHEAVTLCLQTSEGRSENFDKPESQYFDYEVKADYEVIDIVDVPQNIFEIGVYEDETCVGAVVVQDSSVQILVYSDNANREPVPFNFEIITGRGGSTPIKNYEVYNFNTGSFEPGILISQMQNYSLVRLGELGEPQNIIPTIDKLQLHGNYPNPFNPETNISFSLPKEQKIELTIYNLKGQKVRQLVSGQLSAGEHSVIWEGKEDNGKQVSSGLYLYKLKTKDQELSKKMLLLK